MDGELGEGLLGHWGGVRAPMHASRRLLHAPPVHTLSPGPTLRAHSSVAGTMHAHNCACSCVLVLHDAHGTRESVHMGQECCSGAEEVEVGAQKLRWSCSQ